MSNGISISIFCVILLAANGCTPSGDNKNDEAASLERGRAPGAKRVVVGTMSGPITDVEGVTKEVRDVKKLLDDLDVVAQNQGSLMWLIWVDNNKQTAARKRIEGAIGAKKFRYLRVSGSKVDDRR